MGVLVDGPLNWASLKKMHQWNFLPLPLTWTGYHNQRPRANKTSFYLCLTPLARHATKSVNPFVADENQGDLRCHLF